MIGRAIAPLLEAVDGWSKRTIGSACFLETTDGRSCFVAKDGSMMTVLRIDGAIRLMGEPEMDELIDRLRVQLGARLTDPGHAIQVHFTRDPDLSRKVVDKQAAAAIGTARSLGLELSDVFDERKRNLPAFVVHEQTHIVVWTRMSVLSAQERKGQSAEASLREFPVLDDAQDVFKRTHRIRSRHVAFAKSTVEDLAAVGIRATILDANEAMKAMRGSIYPDLALADWKPHLLGTHVGMRVPMADDGDLSHLLWPRIEDQLFTHEGERMNPRIARVGSKLFSAIDMTVGPEEIAPFQSLINRMRADEEFPWRVSFLLEPLDVGVLRFKALAASILQITSKSNNRPIKEAIQDLDRSRERGETIVRMRTSFCTWAPATQPELIEQRSDRLKTTVESWGNCGASPMSGDPVMGTMSSALGLDVASTAPSGAVPLQSALSMMPWARGASPFASGSVAFRTADGRMWPYQPGSSQMDAFIDLIFAPSGMGKSVLLSSVAFAFTLSPAATVGRGGVKLPRMAIIDIGPSSMGLIQMIRDALPTARRHEAVFIRLQRHEKHSINPFDTQLGCRHPTDIEKGFLVNFLSAIGTPAGASAPPQNVAALASFVVDDLYTTLSDHSEKSRPKQYTPGTEHMVDEAVAAHGIHVDHETRWWDLVDAFFDLGDIHMATVAQRQAVPRLEDVVGLINADAVESIFGSAKTAEGEAAVQAFERDVIVAMRDMPHIARATRLDLGDARIIALDLDEVAPRGGEQNRRETALMYMLARNAAARDFYLNETFLTQSKHGAPVVTDRYREYHTERVARLRETPKRLVYDEFHRTEGLEAVQAQVQLDVREGRKWNVHIALSSQRLEDFQQGLIDNATGTWILGARTPDARERAAKMFGLSETARYHLAHTLTGPKGAQGAPFLVRLALKNGTHEHMLYNTLGPVEMWAFSTTSQDASLRKAVCDVLGPEEGRRRLAKRFQQGTATKEIERRLALLSDNGRLTQDAKHGVVQELVNEIIAMPDVEPTVRKPKPSRTAKVEHAV